MRKGQEKAIAKAIRLGFPSFLIERLQNPNYTLVYYDTLISHVSPYVKKGVSMVELEEEAQKVELLYQYTKEIGTSMSYLLLSLSSISLPVLKQLLNDIKTVEQHSCTILEAVMEFQAYVSYEDAWRYAKAYVLPAYICFEQANKYRMSPLFSITSISALLKTPGINDIPKEIIEEWLSHAYDVCVNQDRVPFYQYISAFQIAVKEPYSYAECEAKQFQIYSSGFQQYDWLKEYEGAHTTYAPGVEDFIDLMKQNYPSLAAKSAIDWHGELSETCTVYCNTDNYRISFDKRKTIHISPSGVFLNNPKEQYKIVLDTKGDWYLLIKKGRIPLSYKQLATIYKTYHSDFCRQLILRILDTIAKQTLVAKDMKPYIAEDQFLLPTLSINASYQYHNLQEAFAKTKTVLPINWNKPKQLNFSYLKTLIAPYFDEDSQRKLYNMTDASCMKHITSNRIKTKRDKNKLITEFLTWYYSQTMKETFAPNLVKDYISMKLQAKEKLSFNVQGIQRMKAEHDRLAIEYRQKCTPVVKIPKNSQFLKLRKLLPKEMKWIRSKKRLIEESMQQSNCVWLYAEKINYDKCAIYSFVYEPEQQRYTVEFGYSSNKGYYVAQIEKTYNQGHSEEALAYVQGFLQQQVVG